MFSNISPEQLAEYKTLIVQYTIDFLPPILLGGVILFFGIKLVNWFSKHLKGRLTKGHFDITIAKFLSNLFNFGLKALLIITVAGIVGIETSSFVAIIGAAGLAVGLALQGSLANFAGGVLILMFKPYEVGDRIELEGEIGQVEDIDILLTTLITRDKKVVIIPNGQAADEKIVNFTKKGPMMVAPEVGVGYDVDILEAKKVLTAVIESNQHILNSPAPQVQVTSLADSAVVFRLFGAVHAKNAPLATFSLLEEAKIALDEAGIEIPFPQRVVHMKQG